MKTTEKAKPSRPEKRKAVGYDKYIDWKIFFIPVAVTVAILALPPLEGMRDVGTEYSLGPKVAVEHVADRFFQKKPEDLEQWQLLVCNVMERSLQTGAFGKKKFLQRDEKWCRQGGIPVDKANLERAKKFVETVDGKTYTDVAKSAALKRTGELRYDRLSGRDREAADKGVWNLKVALAVMIFTVLCFLTGCIPLPAVAFCIGLILVFAGVVTRTQVAALYWSDACWFIMGSLMFAAVFVKTGVDKRICLFLFSKLARPSAGAVTLVLIAVIAPAASFISDHALAAIFLPIAIILHRGSQQPGRAPDMELGKMLMITVAMACNIGGFGAPSGGARNVIMMTYLEDMFGVSIGYLAWVTYAMPFVVIMMPLTWLAIQWRFKPRSRDLSPALVSLKQDIARMGGWNRQQVGALVIFIVMLWFWFTEDAFFKMGIYPVRLGIGVVAVAGAVAYILTGIANWRDYQQNVDWGVVWLYAGAIIFGKVLDETGAAYYLARSAVDLMAGLGLESGVALLSVAGVITGGMTQLMADGPCAAAVGPVTLNMAGIASPGTTLMPFMAMVTACASSFAYCLVIGTPPNAIVYASGYLEPKDYLRVGIPLWVAANITLIALVVIYWTVRGFGGLPGF